MCTDDQLQIDLNELNKNKNVILIIFYQFSYDLF